MASESQEQDGMQGLTRIELFRRAGIVTVTLGIGPTFATSAHAASARERQSGEIDFLGWQGYDFKGVAAMDRWRKQKNISLNSSYINAYTDIIPKIKGPGGIDWDLTTVFSGLTDQFRGGGAIVPLDPRQIPNLKNLFPVFQKGVYADRFWKKSGKWWMVPFSWGGSTMNYRADLIKPPARWIDLLKPEYKGKIGWAGGPDGGIGLSAHILGYRPDRLTRDQFKRVFQLMRKLRANTGAFGITFGQLAELMASGDVVLSFNGWSFVNTLAAKKGADVRDQLPKDGSVGGASCFAIPPTADNEEAAYSFINKALDSTVQAQYAAALAEGVTTRGGYSLLDESLRKAYPYLSLNKILKNRLLFMALPPFNGSAKFVGYRDWLAAWAKFKAGK